MSTDHGLPQIRRVAQHAALFAAIRQELLAEAIEAAVGPDHSYDVDHSQQRLSFVSDQGQVHLRAHLVASVALEPRSLLWGFAAPFAPYVGPDPLAARIREAGRANSLSELVDEEVAYDLGPGQSAEDSLTNVAHDVGMVGVELFGPSTFYYTFAAGNGSRQTLLVEQGDLALAPVDLPAVFVRLARLVPQLDDVRWSLDGLVRLRPGWSLTERPSEQPSAAPAQQRLRLTDETGAYADIELTHDEQGRLTGLHSEGVRRT